MECRQKENLKICNCPHQCSRKGFCCLCVVHHRAKGQLPACYFSNKVAASFNRSIETYLKEQGITLPNA